MTPLVYAITTAQNSFISSPLPVELRKFTGLIDGDVILALATTVRVLGLVNVNINILKYFKVKNFVDTTKSLRNEHLSNLSCSNYSKRST